MLKKSQDNGHCRPSETGTANNVPVVCKKRRRIALSWDEKDVALPKSHSMSLGSGLDGIRLVQFWIVSAPELALELLQKFVLRIL